MKDLVTVVAVLGLVVVGFFAVTQKTVVEAPQTPLAGFATADLNTPYLKVNGVHEEYRSQAFALSTTTVCSIQSPTFATSTLVGGVVKTATTTDYVLHIAKSLTSRQATTTNIRTETVTEGGEVLVLMASTTHNAAADTTRTFAPGTFLNVGISTLPSPSTSLLTGTCSAVFIVGT